MGKVNFDWAREQLQRAKARRGPGEAALILLKTWETIELPPEMVEHTLETFSKLAQGHALVPDEDAVWRDCVPGQVKVGEEVRVKVDAFPGEAGQMHNGRVGRVVAVRSGDVIIRTTDDRKPMLDGAHYSPWKLEKRIR